MSETHDSRLRSRAAVIEDYLALLLRLFLAALFIYSAWHKIEDPISFMIKVSEYEVLPVRWEETFAYVLPWGMVICSGLLALGFLARAGAAGQALMLVSFIVAISVNIYRDRVLGCGCFSEEGHQVGPLLVVQDFALLAMCAYIIIRGARRFSIDSLLYKRLFPNRPEK